MKSDKLSSSKKLFIFNKYVMIFLFIFFLLGVGGTYAYYAFQVEDEATIVGNVISIDVDLKVELVVGTNTKMVPMQDAALSNAINGVGSENGACIDSLGNLSCQVYKITLTNNGSRIKNIIGTVELYAKEGNDNVYQNLKWRELTNTTTVKENSIINGMEKSILVSNLTMESKEERVWYIAVYISEQNYDQRETDKGLFGGTVTFEPSEGSSVSADINEPNLDNNNLIPVYYDDTVLASDGTYGVWKKADSSNVNNSWYDYNSMMWANAVIISDEATTDYSSVAVGTTIVDADIIAFYVWIPRYKYRVWNITRQGGAESTYAYPAYSMGIEIEFEDGTASTGNVECTYNVRTAESATNLSDVCVYNGTDTITTTSGNTNYADAWYTHPAFTFGDKEIEGFWIGKFETSGSRSSPKIIPDAVSLGDLYISTEFTTSKVFQNYLSSDINAHMLTNLEWGAVAYLTHSIYGLCDGTSCQGLNHNNSNGVYTGRSGGAIAGSTALNLANVYPENSTSTTKYNTNGYYTYKGYFIDYNGNVTTTRDISKVASTTGNITGVYDISGGKSEFVMGNMVDSSYAFNPSSSGTNWNGSTTLDSQYYNSYSYGTSYNDAKAFNRARLGDATAEILGGVSSTGSWKVGTGITGAYSEFSSLTASWFYRGGYNGASTASGFYFIRHSGYGSVNYSFRSSLS